MRNVILAGAAVLAGKYGLTPAEADAMPVEVAETARVYVSATRHTHDLTGCTAEIGDYSFDVEPVDD